MDLAPFLLLVLLSVLALSTADDNSTTASIVFPLPSHCSKSFDYLRSQYPFGVGHGCFRPGFELTCINCTIYPESLSLGHTSSEIEFLDVRFIDSPLSVKAPVAIMDANNNFSYISWTAPSNAPYFLSAQNYLWVIGCSAVGSLVDLTSNHTLTTCNTKCPHEGVDLKRYHANPASCYGVGCCNVSIEGGLQSYGIMLSRKKDNRYASVVKSFVGETNGNMNMNWYINDQPSCEEAEKELNNYACRSRGSVCVDYFNNSTNISHGYKCSCPSPVGDGNPYVPGGCNSVTVPSTNCTTKCGNLSIPFPFGLENGCYRDASFALTCNKTSSPPVLTFNRDVVNNIMVNEGEMEVTPSDNYDGTRKWLGSFSASSYGSFAFLGRRTIFNWTIRYSSCKEEGLKYQGYACRSSNSTCVDTHFKLEYPDEYRPGYNCKCLDGFEGNPYISDGCRDIDECQNPEIYVCFGDCVNTVGNYFCSCPVGTYGDPKKGPCIAHKKDGLLLGIIVGVCVGFGTLLLVITSVFATGKWKKINQKRIRKKYFCQNHGLLLQQLIASYEENAEKIKIFSLEELEKATNNFDTSRILGQGGHGIVYKGILSDRRVVAIKRSKITMMRKIDEFVNEVIVLSQINHRNIVKIFGCCLETEVPLLVYEFISNGTLFYHLHHPDGKSILSWKDRLRIAIEVAGALAYLHSSASVSILHRDMKSSNILLDEYYTGKVSDFGTSRFIRFDQSHIFTVVQGTLGYLDPEYYQTWRFTDKSDVYSFGVVLLELLTGRKSFSSSQGEEEENLVTQFLRLLKENQQFDLVDARVMDEGTNEEITAVAKLVEMCLKLKGSERPTMKEVEVQLRFLNRANDIIEYV